MENSLPTIHAVIFDMGGVILRTESRVSRSHLAKKLGMTRQGLEDVVFQSAESKQAELGEITEKEHWEHIARMLNFPQEDLPEFWREYWDGDQADEELVSYIRALRRNFKTGLLSNAWHGVREMVTRQYHFLSAFDAVIFSADVHLRKPDPRVFRLMLARLGVKAHEAVFVDDFIENIEGASALGLHTVLFRTREQVLAELLKLGVG